MREGVVRQDALTERVNGGDVGHVEGKKRLLEEPPGFAVDRPAELIGNRRRRFAPAAREELLELGSNPVRQLPGSLVRESDGKDVFDRRLPDEQELQDEVLERVGLSRPGGGLDHRVTLRRDPRERLRLLVARSLRHPGDSRRLWK